MKVYKFGGTSVGKPERMKQVAQITQQDSLAKIVVLSALSGVTNQLVSIAESISQKDKETSLNKIESLKSHHQSFIKELLATKKSQEKAELIIQEHIGRIQEIAEKNELTTTEEKEILAQGELLSTKLFYTFMQEQNKNAVLLPALELMKINEDDEPDEEFIKNTFGAELKKYPNTNFFITQGYICRNFKGEIDNLKRGGSDYTASLIGSVLGLEEIQIWTDIDGMHNNDPRFVENTYPIAELSFDEAAELAYFGAKILHPASIIPAQKYAVPVRLLNTMEPSASGTLISQKPNHSSTHQITAIAAKDGITAIKIKSTRMLLAYGFLRKVFEVFEKYKTPIDMITTSEVAVSLTIDNDEHLEEITKDLNPYGLIEIDKNQTIVCVVGDFVSEREGTALRILEALKKIPLRMIAFGGSKHNISLLIKEKYKNQALNDLQKTLFEA